VAEARGLRTSDFLGSAPDPYAVLQLREVRYQSRKERSTKNPCWQQEFELYGYSFSIDYLIPLIP
jgi:Ca2+-dependent lipid-binding protein